MGANFGVREDRIDSVTFGPTGNELTATGCVIAEPDVRLVCKTPAGVGRQMRWRVRIGGQTSALTATKYATSYSPPRLLEVRPNAGVPTEGGAITVVGDELAPDFFRRNPKALQLAWGNARLDIVTVDATRIVATVLRGQGVAVRKSRSRTSCTHALGTKRALSAFPTPDASAGPPRRSSQRRAST